MKNGYFLHEQWIAAGASYTGCRKKYEEQQKMLSTLLPMTELSPQLGTSPTMAKILKRIPFGPSAFQWEKLEEKIENPGFLYIRKPTFCRGFCNLLKRIRKKYPDVKILLEIATYPYDKELFTDKKNLPMYPNEVYYRNQLQKYVDRIVTFSADAEIFGIPTIRIQNGIDVEAQPVRPAKMDTESIHLIAVASFQRAHGCERIIRGLADYYQNGGTREIILDMVGSGEELPLYQQMTNDLKLQDHIVFWGPRYGDDLTHVFETADIGIAPLGFYKHGIEISSALKVREYLARGLPVVAGSKQDLFTEETFPYYLEFPNDSSAIDVERIVKFYDRVYRGEESYGQVIHNIRKYAKENIDWKKTFFMVLQYLSNNAHK